MCLIDVSAGSWFLGRFGLGAADFIHDVGEVVHILKAAIDAGKADIAHFVQALELIHDQLAKAAGVDLALAEIE